MKNRLWIVLSILLFSMTAVTSTAMAMEPFGGHYYEVVSESVIWETANEYANVQDTIDGTPYYGHLAVINSPQENEFVYNLIVNTLNSGGRGWIGGYQLPDQAAVSDGWRWVTGETMSYTYWDITLADSPIYSPNDAGGPSSGVYPDDYPYPLFGLEDNAENCMEMRRYGYWDDMNCSTTTYFYVIEYEPVLELITDGGDNPTDIGDLHITYINSAFNVEYVLDSPWEIVETHVYIGDEVPSKSAPGRFPYSAGVIPFTTDEGFVFIAAHAEVKMPTGKMDENGYPIYVYESVWAQVNDGFSDTPIGKGRNWATYFEYNCQ